MIGLVTPFADPIACLVEGRKGKLLSKNKLDHHKHKPNHHKHKPNKIEEEWILKTKDYNRKLAEGDMLFASQDVDMKAILKERKHRLNQEAQAVMTAVRVKLAYIK